jgi:hypothetical protein
MLNVSSAKLTGNPGISGWAQVHEFKPDDSLKLESRGHFFAVIATGKESGEKGGVALGREILIRLHEEYFGKDEGTSFNALKSAVAKVIKEFFPTWGNIEIAAVACTGDVVYSVAGGGSQVAIFREGMLAKILVSKDEDIVSASGYPKENDTLILGTKRFFESIPNGVIKAALESGGPQVAAEALAPSVHANSDTGSLGAVILNFKKGDTFLKTESQNLSMSGKENLRLGISATPGLGPIQFFGKIGGEIKNTASRIIDGISHKRIYVRERFYTDKPQSKKTSLLVGTLILVILFVSIAFGIKRQKDNEYKGRYEVRLSEAQKNYDEAVNLATLDPNKARELFSQSKSEALSLKGEGIEDIRLGALINKIEEKQGQVLGEYRVGPQLYLDLSLLSNDFVGDLTASSGEKFYVLDKSGKKIVGINFNTKKSEVVAGPDQVEGALSLAAYEGRVFILTDSGVYEVGNKKSKVIEKDWEGEVLPYAYTGNIYILDKGARTIRRYVGTGGSFSRGQIWLAPTVIPDFSKVVSITIDGTVWVLTSTGKILKFSLGSPQSFVVPSVTPALTNPTFIYSNLDLKNLYILDPANKRVLVLSKTGDYIAQYFSDNLSEAKSLVVSEETKKLVFLAGSKLYSIELKHLD